MIIREHQYRTDQPGGPCTYKWHVIPCGRARNEHEEVDYKTKADDRDMGKQKMKSEIIVHVDFAGASKMIEHILDGSLAEFHPSVTVGASASLNGVPIPKMNEKGKVETDEQGKVETDEQGA